MTLFRNSLHSRVEDAPRLAAFLQAEGRIGSAELEGIVQLQRAQELTFSEAAIALGYVTAEEIQTLSAGLPQTSMPAAQGQVSSQLALSSRPLSMEAEQLRALRTTLLLKRAEGANAMAIVSSERGEGRSQLAAELAIGFAQMQQPTLLIDADLRQPQIHKLFGLPAAPGLHEVLTGRSVAQPAGIHSLPALAVLTAGSPCSNPSDLLTSRVFADLLQGWQRAYRHVIVDTSAMAQCSDALPVAIACTQVLTLARQHRAQLAPVRESLRQLRGAGVRILGGVLVND